MMKFGTEYHEGYDCGGTSYQCTLQLEEFVGCTSPISAGAPRDVMCSLPTT